jgi:hypothetical protein
MAREAFHPATVVNAPTPDYTGPRLPSHFSDALTQPPSDEELRDAFLSASSNTPGPDGVPLSFLKYIWNDVAPFAMAICSAVLTLGVFPSAFKRATVVTLSKPGRDPRSYKGWRPISLLSVFGKGIERMVARRMTAAALRAGLLPPEVAGAHSNSLCLGPSSVTCA